MNHVIQNKIATAQRVIAGFVTLITGQKARVKWGSEASCDSTGLIKLPRPKTGEAEEIAIMCRQALHEAGHFTHTDFDGLQTVTANEMALINCMEDPRMEREQMARYPGASLILNRGLEEIYASLEAALDPNNPEHHARLVMLNVLLKGYLSLAPHATVVSRSATLVGRGDQVLGSERTEAVNQAIESLVHATNTADVRAIALELAQKLFKPPQPQQQPQPEQQPEQQAGQQQEQQQSPDSQESGNEAGDESGQESKSASKDEGEGQAQSEAESESEAKSQGKGESQDTSDDDSGEGAGQGGEEGESSADQAPGQATGQGGGEGGDGGGDTSPHLDLSSEAGTDMGKLLQQAYESKYGAPDLQASNDEPMESDGIMEKALERSLQQPQSKDRDLQQTLAEVEQEVQAQEQKAKGPTQPAADPSEASEPAVAGGGNSAGGGARSESGRIEMDVNVRLSGLVSRLVRVFAKELQDKRRRPSKLAPAGGQVVGNRVWRIKRVGDMNVFRVRSEVTGIDAAATILLDRSGSMDGCIKMAAEVSVACAQALERISKVKTSIEMFPGSSHNTQTLQAFGESARQIQKRVQDVYACGGTPLAEAIAEVVPKLMAQRVTKRVLLIVTDGEPNNVESAMRALEHARKSDIEVMGIGIGYGGSSIKRMVPASVAINEASELPGALEKMFNSHFAEKLAA